MDGFQQFADVRQRLDVNLLPFGVDNGLLQFTQSVLRLSDAIEQLLVQHLVGAQLPFVG